MKLIGVDVGFSRTRPTTGIAILNDDHLIVRKTGSAWDDRSVVIPEGFQPSVIAIDGPLIPDGANERCRRRCENLFVRKPFHNRCKPGLSHSGYGFDLRRAAAETCKQFSRTLVGAKSGHVPAVRPGGPIVEAFPNAFLGVLTTEAEYLSSPRFRRGARFDWLYCRVASSGRLEKLLSQLLCMPSAVWKQVSDAKDHEHRAALICLLTAGLAQAGLAEIVGDDSGGWFWLPPRHLWESWASDGLESQTRVGGDY